LIHSIRFTCSKEFGTPASKIIGLGNGWFHHSRVHSSFVGAAAEPEAGDEAFFDLAKQQLAPSFADGILNESARSQITTNKIFFPSEMRRLTMPARILLLASISALAYLQKAACFLPAQTTWPRSNQNVENDQRSRTFLPSNGRIPSNSRSFSTIEKVSEEVVENLKYEKPSSGDSSGSNSSDKRPKIVLVAGFESFNRDLYTAAAKELDVDLTVFADSDIRSSTSIDPEDLGTNPVFEQAMKNADAFVGSLIFDYDDALVVESLLPYVKGPRLIFESATELMSFNQVGTFSMNKTDDDGPSGPPPAVQAVLSKFGSGKEEDKLSGYLKLLKIGPSLLKFVPGEKASDLRTWLEAYRYWNQGGKKNVEAMLGVIADLCSAEPHLSTELPELVVTPDIGITHPLRQHLTGSKKYFESPAAYISWRLSKAAKEDARKQKFQLAPDDAPRAAVLLYRKHVITELRYIDDLITIMEAQGIIPIPIFINGVEAHTIVRDLLTSEHEIRQVSLGKTVRDSTYQPSKATAVDCIVNTVGFPLVGGPAGSMEAGRNVAVAEKLLSSMNVPYIVASPLLLQNIQQWKTNGVLGLQSVVLYSLPELDGAIDTVVLGGLVGDKIALVPERVRKLTSRVKGWTSLKRTPKADRKIAVSLYGFPPNVGAVGTAALLDVPRSLDNLLGCLHKEGYDLGDWETNPSKGQSLVAAMSILCENPVITGGADRMQDAIDAKIQRAIDGDETVAATLAQPGGGLGGARVRAKNMSFEELEKILGKYMTKKVRRAWSEKDVGPGVSGKGDLVVAGLQIGNVWIFVQPLLGVEGDPMRLLFERDLTPHPQYCAAYELVRLPEAKGGIGAQAIIHFG
jgi:magnesium chelatase subunit H